MPQQENRLPRCMCWLKHIWIENEHSRDLSKGYFLFTYYQKRRDFATAAPPLRLRLIVFPAVFT